MSAFDSFVSAHLRLAPGKTAKTTDVVAGYTAFTGGSVGKLKLYAHVKAMEGVKKVRQTFTGIELIEFVNAPAKISNELPEKSPEVIRLEIELRRIALEERKEEREAMKTKHAKEMEERRAALKAMEIEGAKAIEAMKEASAGRLKAMDLAWEKEKAERQEAEKIRDREFWAAENNKNRKMYVETERWNRYLDMRAYGTPSKQYIERDSLFDNFDFRVFDAIGKIDAPAQALIREEIDSASVTVPVWEREAIRPYEVVDVDHVTEVIDRVMEKIEAGREAMKESFKPVHDLLDRIPGIASRDDRRFVNTTYERELACQNPTKFATVKTDKRSYIREANKAYMKGNDTRILCYCCRKDVSLKSSACHRSHNIPRSFGGDWSINNIYLCWATCNADMEDHYTVLEYKVLLFIRELQDMKRTAEELRGKKTENEKLTRTLQK